MTTQPVGRRTVLGGAALLGAGAALTACGGRDSTSARATGTTPAVSTATADSIGGAPAVTPTAAAGGATASSLGAATAIPVGGGVIVKDQKVVVTQPVAGTYKAFSAVCTHQGCLVSQVTSAGIVCNCHGSTFSTTDGSVLVGPATDPLKEEKVVESGGTLKLG